MTGETQRSPSGWTPDTLKVLEDEKVEAVRQFFGAELKRLEAVIAGQERAVTLLGQANQIAQDKFEATVRDGFVKQNEFRGSLDDLGKTMATRREMEAFQEEYRRAHTDLVRAVADLRSRIDIGPAGLDRLQARADISRGRQEGIGASANVIAAVIAVLITTSGLVTTVYFATH